MLVLRSRHPAISLLSISFFTTSLNAQSVSCRILSRRLHRAAPTWQEAQATRRNHFGGTCKAPACAATSPAKPSTRLRSRHERVWVTDHEGDIPCRPRPAFFAAQASRSCSFFRQHYRDAVADAHAQHPPSSRNGSTRQVSTRRAQLWRPRSTIRWRKNHVVAPAMRDPPKSGRSGTSGGS
jgi:hypothetical protein